MFIALLWTALFLAAAGFSVYNLNEARKDAEALKKTKKNGPFSRVAKGAIREESVRCAVFAIYSSIGFLSVTGVEGFDGFYSVALLMGGVGMLFNSIQSFNTRRSVLEYGEMGSTKRK